MLSYTDSSYDDLNKVFAKTVIEKGGKELNFFDVLENIF